MENQIIENMICWAEGKLGDSNYAGWCLSFIEDALEISNNIEIIGGDSAKESSEIYRDALRDGIPEKGAFVFYDCMCLSEEGPINWGHCGIALANGQIIHAWDKVRIDDYRDIEKLTALTGDHPRYLGWVPVTRVLAEKNPNVGNEGVLKLTHCGTQKIETHRLILRPFTAKDAEAMYENWANSEEVTRYLTWPPHSSVEATRSLLEAWVEEYRNPAVYHWGIVLKGSDRVIGDISVVHIDEKTAAAELGWCIGQAWWGQGIMPEAALAVRDYLFDRAGFHRVEARHDKNNPKSGRVMQKIGMQYEGTSRASGVNNQGICDIVTFAILREDRN